MPWASRSAVAANSSDLRAAPRRHPHNAANISVSRYRVGAAGQATQCCRTPKHPGSQRPRDLGLDRSPHVDQVSAVSGNAGVDEYTWPITSATPSKTHCRVMTAGVDAGSGTDRGPIRAVANRPTSFRHARRPGDRSNLRLSAQMVSFGPRRPRRCRAKAASPVATTASRGPLGKGLPGRPRRSAAATRRSACYYGM
jgi:hypothetical protein